MTLEELREINELRTVLEQSERARGRPHLGGYEYSDHGMSDTEGPSALLSDQARTRITAFVDAEYHALSTETLKRLADLGVEPGEFSVAPLYRETA